MCRLGIAAYGWRDEIMSRLPPEWRPFLDLDALRILRKQVYTHPTKLGVSCFLAIITAFEK